MPNTSETSNKQTEKGKERIPTHLGLDLTRTVIRQMELYRSHPWDTVPELSSYITKQGIELPYDSYDEIRENVWVHISAYLSPTAKIDGPAIICGGAKICHYAHVTASVIGSFATVGEFSTVNNSILFDRSTLQGHNVFLSSILGYGSHVGYGTIVNDTRPDGDTVAISMPEGTYLTGKTKIGAVICDGVKIGASCLLRAGTVVDYGSKLAHTTHASGYLYPYSSFGTLS